MKLFRIWQDINNDYDTYSDAVVCAENEEEARYIRPDWDNGWTEEYSISWVTKIEDVKAEYLGEAAENLKKGIILASFHAG